VWTLIGRVYVCEGVGVVRGAGSSVDEEVKRVPAQCRYLSTVCDWLCVCHMTIVSAVIGRVCVRVSVLSAEQPAVWMRR